MNLDEIKSILQLMEANKLVEFEYEDDGRRLKLRRAEDRVVTTAMPVPDAIPGWLPPAEKAIGTMLATPKPQKVKAAMASHGQGDRPPMHMPAAAIRLE